MSPQLMICLLNKVFNFIKLRTEEIKWDNIWLIKTSKWKQVTLRFEYTKHNWVKITWQNYSLAYVRLKDPTRASD